MYIVVVYSEIQSMTIVNMVDSVPRVGPYIAYEQSHNTIQKNKRNIMIMDDLHVPVTSAPL